MKVDITTYATYELDTTAYRAGGSWPDRGAANLTVNPTEDNVSSNVSVIGTTWEQVDTGDLASFGYLFIRHIDGTDNLDVAVDVAGTKHQFGLMKPGDVLIVPVSTSAIYVKSAGTTNVTIAMMWLPAH